MWVTGTFDPELNLTYWGTGNPGPWIGDARPGDNLYTNSVIALDADTGELKGHHQYHWNGSRDWDEVDAPLLIDVTRQGRTTKSLVHPGRNGYLWILGREPDAVTFLDAVPYVHQDVFRRLDPETGRPEYDPERRPGTGRRVRFCPSLWGGKDWPAAAYSPQSGYLYIPANENLCSFMEGARWNTSRGRGSQAPPRRRSSCRAPTIWASCRPGTSTPVKGVDPRVRLAELGSGTRHRRGSRVHGRHERPAVPRVRRRHRRGVLGTADQLRHHGRAVLYAVDGVQYIAVQSGWGVDAQRMQGAINNSDERRRRQVPQGGVLWVFALPR